MSSIKKIKIKDIKPSRYNPRKITDETRETLKSSIEEFGLVDPIIINLKTNNIIGGHQRFDYFYNKDKDMELSLIELGDIGWVYLDEDLEIKDAEHEKALNIALNKISADWDINSLNNLLDELQGYGLDGLTGFDYSLDDFDYEYIPLEEDEDDDEYVDDESFEEDIVDEESIRKVIEPTTGESVQTMTQHQTRPQITIPENTIYKNKNNIIYYGKTSKKNKETLLKTQDTIQDIGETYQDLKLVKTIPVNHNYYITDSEETIKQVLQDTNTERIR